MRGTIKEMDIFSGRGSEAITASDKGKAVQVPHPLLQLRVPGLAVLLPLAVLGGDGPHTPARPAVHPSLQDVLKQVYGAEVVVDQRVGHDVRGPCPWRQSEVAAQGREIHLSAGMEGIMQWHWNSAHG